MTDRRANELRQEQGYFDTAGEARVQMVERLTMRSPGELAADPKAAHAMNRAHRQRLKEVDESDEAVAFGRTTAEDGETLYIGYGLIVDEDYEPLVINWQAQAAAPYFQATHEAPSGLLLRRQFLTDGNSIVDLIDILYGRRPDDADFVPQRDALLRELDRSRDGRLRDIVRTIEAAQDRVMRAPFDEILVVQGGPGTGKTIVGLQRLSVLLYEDPTIEPFEVLVVGPSRAFVRYIEQVLPSLGDDDVQHRAVQTLGPGGIRVRGLDDIAVARLKGDSRIAELLSRFLADQRRVPDDPVELDLGQARITVSPDDMWDLTKDLDESGIPHNQGRDRFRNRLAEQVRTRLNARAVSVDIPEGDIRQQSEFQNLINRVWPRFSPQEALRDLYSSERRLETLRWDILTSDEAKMLFRPAQQRLSDEAWTEADVALLDEMNDLLNGFDVSYRHIVIDEAQDLSPMQARSLRRRVPTRSITLMGDLEQATGPWARESWEGIVQDIDAADQARVVDLSVGYRVPAEVMEVAQRIVDATPADNDVPRSVRRSGFPPTFVRREPAELMRSAVEETRSYLSNGLTVAVIATEVTIARTRAAFDYEGIEWADGREGPGRAVTLVPAFAAKGLEFDAVIVIEPGEIVGLDGGGPNLLYVAVTRTTKRLSVLTSVDLPAFWTAFEPPGQDESGRTELEQSAEDVSEEENDGFASPRIVEPRDDGLTPDQETASGPPDTASASHDQPGDRGRRIVGLMADGHSYQQILRTFPDLTYPSIFHAVAEVLEALERAEQAVTVTSTVPVRSHETWDGREEADLVRELREGLSTQGIADAHGRSVCAITSRSVKLWREGRLERPPE